MADHNELGRKGEDEAARYLQRNGYEIIERNWIFDRHEVDIIARNDEYIVFVEVKTRSSNQWGNPEEAVSKARIKRMVQAADFYLNEYDIEEPVRFDVMAVLWNGRTFEIEHIDDAFLAPLN